MPIRNANDYGLTSYFSREDLRTVEVDEILFNIVFNNKDYFNRCRELNPDIYHDVAKFFCGAKLKWQTVKQCKTLYAVEGHVGIVLSCHPTIIMNLHATS